MDNTEMSATGVVTHRWMLKIFQSGQNLFIESYQTTLNITKFNNVNVEMHKVPWWTKFLGTLPKTCPLHVLYKIPLAQGNFLLSQHNNFLAVTSVSIQ